MVHWFFFWQQSKKSSREERGIRKDIYEKKRGRIIRVDYYPDIKDAQIKKLWEDLGKQFGFISSNKKGSYQEVIVGTPEEVAQGIIFAIENDFITGTTIDVDGGWLLS